MEPKRITIEEAAQVGYNVLCTWPGMWPYVMAMAVLTFVAYRLVSPADGVKD